ncbi:hypothetical protein V1512DRAFT_248877 [Lipomyces arxii]|uniref:mitochondrial 54S ribosomal protein uL24m n=1 Tax=Lipomyces arxii TaxID=56418 RepID=UPI0034CD9AE8
MVKPRVPRYSNYMRNYNRRLRENVASSKRTTLEQSSLPAFYPSILRPPGDGIRGRKVTDFMYRTGDTVQVIKGPDRGVITTVTNVYPDDSVLLLARVGPEKEMVVPKVFWQEGQQQYVMSMNGAVHHDDVRLVTNMQDDAGQTRKVAVAALELGDEYWDDRYRRMLRRRVVPHTDGIVIPWPDPASAVGDGEFATDAQVARERTFYVTAIDVPPVPLAALDSLRKKFSRFRKPELTSEEIARLTPPEMPIGKARAAFRAEREAWKESKREMKESGEAARIELESAVVLQRRTRERSSKLTNETSE